MRRKQRRAVGKLVDLTGQRFGRLTVIERAENYISPKGKQAPRWICQCECGATVVVVGESLRGGVTKSCGCFFRECASKSNTTHGQSKTRLFKIWKGMKNRCYNPNNSAYKMYGGRGVTVCKEWANDFQPFYDWAMSNGYTEKLSIDRIDVNGNYEPSNCRWATQKDQVINRRGIKRYCINGEEKAISEWCELYQKNLYKVCDRISKLGWTIEEALDLAPRKK